MNFFVAQFDDDETKVNIALMNEKKSNLVYCRYFQEYRANF